MMILQTTLCLAAAAAIINVWLSMRTGKMRMHYKVSVGDGGHEPLLRRMRAQANFLEQVPITLILFAAVEVACIHKPWSQPWLALLGGAFMLGRVAHAYGMDSDTSFKPGRPIGMITSMLTQVILVVLAVLLATGRL